MNNSPLPDNVLDKFTERARRTLDHAHTLARRFPGKTTTGTVTHLHLLAAIAQQEGGIGATILKSTNPCNKRETGYKV